MMLYLGFILFTLVGGVLYRFRGGWPTLTRPIEQILFCAPLFYLCFTSVSFLPALVASIACLVAVLKGHGTWMSYRDLGRCIEPEWLDWIVNIFFGKDPRFFTSEGRCPTEPLRKHKVESYGVKKLYWRGIFGMSLSGLFSTIPVGIVTGNIFIGLCGALKGLAYLCGRKLHPNVYDGAAKVRIGKFTLVSDTEWGEFLTGAFIWGVLYFFVFPV